MLNHGEPFFFKSHFPHNRVVGGGFYSGFAPLPISEAWDLYGEGNGVASLQEMRTRVSRYRTRAIGAREDPVIGCIFIRDIRFFPTDTSAEPPPGFAPNVVQGKGYDLAVSPALSYFEELLRRLLQVNVDIDLSEPWHRGGPVYGDPRLTPQRLG